MKIKGTKYSAYSKLKSISSSNSENNQKEEKNLEPDKKKQKGLKKGTTFNK